MENFRKRDLHSRTLKQSSLSVHTKCSHLQHVAKHSAEFRLTPHAPRSQAQIMQLLVNYCETYYLSVFV
jgi:hypothetical protein